MEWVENVSKFNILRDAVVMVVMVVMRLEDTFSCR